MCDSIHSDEGCGYDVEAVVPTLIVLIHIKN